MITARQSDRQAYGRCWPPGDLTDRHGRLTVAAVLLFDERPQREYPSAYVRILKYDSDERGVGRHMNLVEEKRIVGSLPQQIYEATAQIEAMLPQRQRLGTGGRFEKAAIIPRDAWLEGLVNAVVHRSYSSMGDHIRVEIFPRRIEIVSPGRFPGIVDPTKPLHISRYARNPRIARVCADMGITRELGEGIKRIFAEMRERGLEAPIYRQTSSAVILTLNAADTVAADSLEKLAPSVRRVFSALQSAAKPLGTGEVAELAGLTRATTGRALQKLEELLLVKWTGKSPRDPRATWRVR